MPVRPLRLSVGMITSHSIESSRKIVWGALLVLAASTAACGGATQSMMGTAPSSLSAVASAPDTGGSFGTLKQGNGKGPGRGGDAPTTGTTPTTGTEPDADDPEAGDESGHGHAAMQLEGFTTSVTGTCPDLTIVINDKTVTTNIETDFQRADCTDLEPAATTTPTTGTVTTTAVAATSFHLHIAATMDATTGDLVATYVRMQGPKIGHGDEEDDDTETTPTTGTTPTR
jgi:hypothetical protein